MALASLYAQCSSAQNIFGCPEDSRVTSAAPKPDVGRHFALAFVQDLV